MSSSSRIAVLGATGQLGSDLVRAAAARGFEPIALGHEDADVTSAVQLARALERAKADVVINSAAFHQVDRCEDAPHQAYQVNAVGALIVAGAAGAVGARCVYVSTDYVFAGDNPPSRNGKLTV